MTMRKLLASTVLLGALVIGDVTPVQARPAVVFVGPDVQAVQYYEPDWRAREEWHRREEWRRREAWREAHRYPPPGYYPPPPVYYRPAPLPYYGPRY